MISILRDKKHNQKAPFYRQLCGKEECYKIIISPFFGLPTV